MDKQTLMLSVVARTLALGRGRLETALSLERCVFIPILHDKYRISLDVETGAWDWYLSYAYLTEARFQEIANGHSILVDEDYQNSEGDILYVPYGLGCFGSSLKSVLYELAQQGSATHIACRREYTHSPGKSRIHKIKVRKPK